MKATDFDLTRDLQLSVDTGIATFRNTRLVILDAGSLGLLRATLVKELGESRARRLFLRFGFTNGYTDFGQMKKKYTFDSEMDLLASGPVIHTWEGIVKAAPTEIRFDRSRKQFYFTGVFEFIEDEKGIMGKVEAAKLTKITQASALGMPDTPENVAALTRAAAQVTGKTPPQV